MEQTPSSQVNGHSALYINHRFNRNPSVVPTSSHVNPINVFRFWLFKASYVNLPSVQLLQIHLVSPIRSAFPAHLTVLNNICYTQLFLQYFAASQFHRLRSQTFYSGPCFQTPKIYFFSPLKRGFTFKQNRQKFSLFFPSEYFRM